MNDFINYFDHIPSLHRSLILVSGITFFWLLESAVPLFRFSYKKWSHAGINFFFTFTTILVNLVLAFIVVKTVDLTAQAQIGVLHWVQMPVWAQLIIGLLLMDFIGAWLAHWTEHHVWWLWQFHTIHHSDTHVDTTTANRHHPGESVIRFVFTTLAVVVTGAPMWLLFLYQSLSVILSQFNHANILLPAWFDKAIGWLIVTPNMHHVHHHYALPLSNTNYGNIFSVWDRLLGTFAQVDNHKLVYGLDTYAQPDEHQRIGTMLTVPFKGYRPPVAIDQPDLQTPEVSKPVL